MCLTHHSHSSCHLIVYRTSHSYSGFMTTTRSVGLQQAVGAGDSLSHERHRMAAFAGRVLISPHRSPRPAGYETGGSLG
jgi:hypothetical protein